MSEDNEEIRRLLALRDYVVKSRRGAAQSQEADVQHLIECQQAIRAIDEAIADERKLAEPGIDEFLKGAIA